MGISSEFPRYLGEIVVVAERSQFEFGNSMSSSKGGIPDRNVVVDRHVRWVQHGLSTIAITLSPSRCASGYNLSYCGLARAEWVTLLKIEQHLAVESPVQ